MSWLGKILTFLVLIGSVVWMYFSVNAFAIRTNWKARADAYEKAFKDSEARREQEKLMAQADRDQLLRLYAAEKARADEFERGYNDIAASSRRDDTAFQQLLDNYTSADVKAQKLAAQVKTIQEELRITRDRNNELENKRQELVLQKEEAERRRVEAENAARLQQTIAEDYARRIETLTALVNELRQTGGSGTAAVLRSIDRVPAPLPENIRGTVVRDIVGEFVQINLGIDAGLEPGSKLDVYREGGGGKYLGTLIVTKSLYPKEAVAEFKPARPVPISQLRPDELPRKGDKVGILSPGPSLR